MVSSGPELVGLIRSLLNDKRSDVRDSVAQSNSASPTTPSSFFSSLLSINSGLEQDLSRSSEGGPMQKKSVAFGRTSNSTTEQAPSVSAPSISTEVRETPRVNHKFPLNTSIRFETDHKVVNNFLRALVLP
jgi:hypothetical protein